MKIIGTAEELRKVEFFDENELLAKIARLEQQLQEKDNQIKSLLAARSKPEIPKVPEQEPTFPPAFIPVPPW